MRVIDLSHPIEEGMPVYPGTEGPSIRQATTIERDGFAEKLISLYSHTGTHLDAPGHVLPGAATLDLLPADRFAGPGLVVEAGSIRDGVIGAASVELALRSAPGAQFLLFRTGWSARWGRDDYFEGFPVLSSEAAALLASSGLKGVGFDAISADPVGAGLRNHRILLGAGMVIIENLRGIELLSGDDFTFCCLPLLIPGGDGSPVRAVALVG
ncbi:MAG: cyclase family protein [Spirochaetes bacterium]|nr:cyclase family protein [Spirochaetota bacterium]